MNIGLSVFIAFATVSALITSDSRAASPVIVDANGTVLAFLSQSISDGRAIGISRQGYVVNYSLRTGAVGNFPVDAGGAEIDTSVTFYSGANCSGDLYMAAWASEMEFTGGVVFAVVSGGNSELRFAAKGAEAATRTRASYRGEDGICVNELQSQIRLFPVFANDPVQTGVGSQASQPSPLRIEVAVIAEPSGLLLRDGFEAMS